MYVRARPRSWFPIPRHPTEVGVVICKLICVGHKLKNCSLWHCRSGGIHNKRVHPLNTFSLTQICSEVENVS